MSMVGTKCFTYTNMKKSKEHLFHVIRYVTTFIFKLLYNITFFLLDIASVMFNIE